MEVRGEWKDGKPHGLCHFKSDCEDGIAIFTDGKVNGGPMWIELPNKKRTSYSYMQDGINKGHFKFYYQDEKENVVTDKYSNEKTPGWAFVIGKSFEDQHYMKKFDEGGIIKQGLFKDNLGQKMIKGYQW